MTIPNLDTFVPNGQLQSYPVPWLLAGIAKYGLSGMLYLESGNTKTWVCCEQGFPIGVYVPNSEVYLGMVMRELGFIDDPTFNESLMMMAKTGKLRGQVLLEMGKITQEQLEQALSVQMMRKLVELFAIHQGNYRFMSGESMPGQMQPLRIHPFKVIYNGIKNCYHDEELAGTLNPLFRGKACRLSSQFSERQGLLGLSREELSDIQCLQQYRRPEEYLAQAKSGTTTAMMLLLILHYCGLMETADLKMAQPITPVGSATDPKPQSKQKKVELPNDFMEKVKEKIEQIKKGDLFALLGVERDFDEARLKHAFLELSKTFHPDRLGIGGDDELRQVLNFVISKINEAFGTLSNPVHREIYFKTMPNKPGETKKYDPDAALVEYEKAKVFINKKNIKEAVKQLRLAHELDPQKAEYKSRMVWYEYLSDSSPTREKLLMVKKELEALFNEAPGNFYVNRYLASIFKEIQDNESYGKYLNKANSIRPTDVETARELRLHNSRKQKKDSQSIQIFGIKIKN